MARSAMLVVLLACVAGAQARGAVSPVQKVIGMIQDFSAKVSKDLAASQANFEEAAKFCDEEATAKDYAIKGTQGDIETLYSTVEFANAKISELESNIQAASSAISAGEGELHKAAEARKAQHATFLAAEKDLLGTIEELSGAAKTLEEQGMTLAQLTPVQKHRRDAVLAGLSQVVEATFVSSGERKQVKAFLQARSDAEDELSLKTESKGVVETIGALTDRAERTLADVRKKEMNANQDYNMLKQSTELGIKSSQAELAETTKAKAVAVESLAQAEKDVAVAKKALAEDTALLGELKRDCQDKARDFELEAKDGKAELKALGAALDILAKKFQSALVQSKAKLVRTAAVAHSSGDDNKARALRAIQQLGKKLHSTALVSLAYRAAADPFGKIRGMVEDMIAKLQKEAAQEATQKAFCDEEMGKSAADKAEKEEKLETVSARIEKAQSSVAVLSEEVATLASEIADIDGAVKEATAIRTKESGAFAAAESDFSASQEACAQAIEVLREYYEGASALVQVGQKGTSKTENTGIIAMLEVAESDFSKMLADARTQETAAAAEYKKLMEESKLSKATKEAEKKGKESQVKSIKTALADSNSDKEGLSSELDAVLSYIAELKPQCETKKPTYAEIKAKRDAEISGLKDALQILEQ